MKRMMSDVTRKEQELKKEGVMRKEALSRKYIKRII
jgi:hypothetical protein